MWLSVKPSNCSGAARSTGAYHTDSISRCDRCGGNLIAHRIATGCFLDVVTDEHERAIAVESSYELVAAFGVTPDVISRFKASACVFYRLNLAYAWRPSARPNACGIDNPRIAAPTRAGFSRSRSR